MSDSVLRVGICGVAGRMGSETARALSVDPLFEVVLGVDRERQGESLREVAGPHAPDLPIRGKLGQGLDETRPDVLVDFTHAGVAVAHGSSAMERGIATVIGTSGLSKEDVRALEVCSKEHSTPGMLVPNFALGAVLLMKFAEMAIKWLPDVEIIELHHDQKADAPSGTARSTADRLVAARGETRLRKRVEQIKLDGVRGGSIDGIHIHSVRLRGLVAHQEVIFGGQGETLTLRHDSLDRTCFMEGVKLCVRKVRNLSGFVVGMDALLD